MTCGFSAAELEEALDALEEFDWNEPESASEPNPDFDQALADEYERVRSAFYAARRNDSDYESKRDAYYNFDTSNVWTTRSCAAKVTLNGAEYSIKEVYNHGGGEGSGEERYVVIEVDGRLFRKDGYYASYDGSYFDGDFREVHAVEKPVTFYEPLDSDSSFDADVSF